jgi:Mycothiol maleylpyruvate isomerase N-terminal domain
MPSSVTSVYLDAAGAATTFLADQEVAAAWDRPSALAEFPVSGLAGHLARQITQVPALLALTDEGAAEGRETISVLDHYDRSAWIGAPLNAGVNMSIRQDGGDEAAGGPADLAKRTAAAAAELAGTLRERPADGLVFLPHAGWCLTLDGYLTTRLVEIVIHADDLAVSTGAPFPLPAPVTDLVLILLTRIAARRHGPEAVLRAFARRERAPETIVVF